MNGFLTLLSLLSTIGTDLSSFYKQIQAFIVAAEGAASGSTATGADKLQAVLNAIFSYLEANGADLSKDWATIKGELTAVINAFVAIYNKLSTEFKSAETTVKSVVAGVTGTTSGT